MSLEVWFEFASTYSYPAAMQVEERCRAEGVDLRWRPFLLGPIFSQLSNSAVLYDFSVSAWLRISR